MNAGHMQKLKSKSQNKMALMFVINMAAVLLKLLELQYSFTSSLSHTVRWKYAVKIVAACGVVHNAEVRSSAL